MKNYFTENELVEIFIKINTTKSIDIIYLFLYLLNINH